MSKINESEVRKFSNMLLTTRKHLPFGHLYKELMLRFKRKLRKSA